MENEPLRALVIEDNAADFRLVAEYLHDAPAAIEVEHAPQLQVGLARLAAARFDAVLVDLNLADSAGLETFQRVHAQQPELPIVILTGLDDEQLALEAVKAGAEDYLAKGRLEPLLLARTVRYAVERAARRRADRRLHEEEKRYRQLLAAVTSYTYSVQLANGAPTATEHSRGCLAATGYAPEDYAADRYLWFRMVHGDDREAVQRYIGRVLAGDNMPPIEHRIHHRDGSVRWVRTTIVTHRDAQGRLVSYDGVVEDVTERKQAEAQVRRERDFAESLVETAHAAVLLLDAHGAILHYNKHLEELRGLPLSETIGEDAFARLLHAAEGSDLSALFAQALRGRESVGGEQPLAAGNGAPRAMRWVGKAVRDSDGRILYVLFTGHDITDLKEAQQRALQAERLAAVGQMITGLAHESRNALQRSQACLSLLSRAVADVPKAVEYIARLQAAQDHLAEIHGEVRSYAAPIVLARKPCPLDEILNEAWTYLQPACEGRRAALRSEPPPVDLVCEVDRLRLGQVFRNVLENALAACDDPVEIAVRWSAAELNGQPAVRVTLRDNGPGLGPEQRARLFEPFYTTKTHGTGLGLAISKRLVEAHGGWIEVGAEPGPGAKIIVTLPRRHGSCHTP